MDESVKVTNIQKAIQQDQFIKSEEKMFDSRLIHGVTENGYMGEETEEYKEELKKAIFTKAKERIKSHLVDTSKLKTLDTRKCSKEGINATMSSTKRSVKKNISFSELGKKHRNYVKLTKALENFQEVSIEEIEAMEVSEQEKCFEEFMNLDFSKIRLGTDQEFVDSYQLFEKLGKLLNVSKYYYINNVDTMDATEVEMFSLVSRKMRQADALMAYFETRCSVIQDPIYRNYKNSEIGNMEHSQNERERQLHKKLRIFWTASASLKESKEKIDEPYTEVEQGAMANFREYIATVGDTIHGIHRVGEVVNFNEMLYGHDDELIVSHLEEKRKNTHPVSEGPMGNVYIYYKHMEHPEENYNADEQKLIQSFLTCMDLSWEGGSKIRRNEVKRLQKMYQYQLKKRGIKEEQLNRGRSYAERLLCDIRDNIFAPMKGLGQIPEGARQKEYKNPKLSGAQMYVSMKEEPLFYTDPCVTDIQQRTVSDCYLLSSLASIAYTNPELIKERMIDHGDKVSVRFVDSETNIVMHENVALDAETSEQVCLEKLLSKYGDDKASVEMDLIELDDDMVILETEETTEASSQEQTDRDAEIERQKAGERVRVLNLLGGNNAARFTEISQKLLELRNSENSDEQLLAQQIDAMLKKVREEQSTDHSGEDEDGLLEENGVSVEERAFREFIDAVVENHLTGTIEEIVSQVQEPVRVDIEEYVTVTKEIPRYAGVVDANAANCLWVQMMEKAFAVRFMKNKGGTYESLSYNTSYYFLEHFLGKEYHKTESDSIVNPVDTDVQLERKVLTAKQITSVLTEQKNLLKKKGYPNGAYQPDIVTVVRALEKNGFGPFSEEESAFIEDVLGTEYGLSYAVFDIKYSDSALHVYQYMQEQLLTGHIITVGRDEKDEKLKERLNSDGIRTNHAYSVLDVEELADGTKMVVLKDPYCRFRRTYYAEQEGDILGSPKVKSNNTYLQLDQDQTSGIFRLTLNDFMQIFTNFTGRVMA